jgi:hypothetical protein
MRLPCPATPSPIRPNTFQGAVDGRAWLGGAVDEGEGLRGGQSGNRRQRHSEDDSQRIWQIPGRLTHVAFPAAWNSRSNCAARRSAVRRGPVRAVILGQKYPACLLSPVSRCESIH